ncbi:MAG: D-amino acid dehydrogenase [Myxococcales bacterium]|nr:D-amino acid dehydrogenase [Myxococcales bacterium]
MKTVVIGAGVVGTMTAYYLQRRGHEVTVVEREFDVAQGACFANGGIVHASEVMPWSQPGMPSRVLRWLGHEDAPVLLRARALPHLLGWGASFLRNCSAARFRENTLANLRLALLSQTSFREVRREVGHDYDLNSAGYLKIYSDRPALDAAVALSESMRADGMNFEVLGAAECAALEPALAPAAEVLAGGIYFPDDELGDSYKFTVGVAEYVKGRGATFHTGTAVEGFDVSGDAVLGLRTSRGRLVADRYVVATGVHTPRLLRPIGLAIPIYPVKGVSVTVPADAWDEPPRMAIIDEARLYAMAPLGERLRVVGSAEVTRFDTAPDARRCQAIVDNATEVFPDFARCYDPDRALHWAGLRPVTPSGTPLLGATRIRNLFLNTGHCHQGFTLSCGSGRVVADIVDRRAPEIDMRGLTLG